MKKWPGLVNLKKDKNMFYSNGCYGDQQLTSTKQSKINECETGGYLLINNLLFS